VKIPLLGKAVTRTSKKSLAEKISRDALKPTQRRKTPSKIFPGQSLLEAAPTDAMPAGFSIATSMSSVTRIVAPLTPAT